MSKECRVPFFNPYKTLRENLKAKPEQHEFLGFTINSLFGMAACPSTGSSAYINAAFKNGFDIITYKTQRSVRYPANSFPNVLQVDVDGHLTVEAANNPIVGYLPESIDPTNLTIANSCGINCEGPEFWMADLRKALESAAEGQLLIMSVVGTIQDGFTEDDYAEDFAITADLAVQAGAKVIEVNMSCPNVASEGIICYTPRVVEDICKRVRAKVGPDVKLLAKIGYFKPNQEELLKEIAGIIGNYFDGITVTNTMSGLIVDRKGKPAFPGPGRERAGISGAAIKWAGIEMVNRLSHLRDTLELNFVIVGVGGVMGPEDYKDYRIAGADAVQSATAAMWNPDLAIQIKNYLQAPYLANKQNPVAA